jgi:hypothetical protein
MLDLQGQTPEKWADVVADHLDIFLIHRAACGHRP